MNLCYALISPQAGVYLGARDGHAVWSRRGPSPLPPAAPTWAGPHDRAHAAVDAELDGLTANGLMDGDEYSLAEVWPDLPDGYASPDAFAKAALATWRPGRVCPRCGQEGGGCEAG